MLAGGLDEENIGEAARLLSPWAVDLSSSVETGGVKDRDKILRIVSVVRDLRKGGERNVKREIWASWRAVHSRNADERCD